MKLNQSFTLIEINRLLKIQTPIKLKPICHKFHVSHFNNYRLGTVHILFKPFPKNVVASV